MPAVLGIEPLAERDQAWRTSQSPAGLGAAPLQSSQFPPPRKSELPTVVVHPGAASVANELPTVIVHPVVTVPKLVLPTGIANPRSAEVVAGAAPRARVQRWKSVAALGCGLAGLLVLVRLVSPGRQEPAPEAARMIVVQSPEWQDRDPPLAALAPTGPAQAASGSSAAASPAEESNTIARQLARRQVALQACFREFSKGGAERDAITLSFDVAAAGQVTVATLEPPALAESAVGQCLLRVARETQFQELHHPVHFSVPLHARAVVN
jgi:hypothetical protein